jgi:hypothetical protein
VSSCQTSHFSATAQKSNQKKPPQCLWPLRGNLRSTANSGPFTFAALNLRAKLPNYRFHSGRDKGDTRFEVRGSRFEVRGSRFEVRGSGFDVLSRVTPPECSGALQGFEEKCLSRQASFFLSCNAERNGGNQPDLWLARSSGTLFCLLFRGATKE